MGIEDLTQYQLLQGFLGLISFSISTVVGIIIISKYSQHKRHELLTVGFMMIFGITEIKSG